MHANAYFNSSFPFDFYVCSCCVFRKFRAIVGYISLSSVTLIDGNKKILKNAFMKSKSEEIKKNIELYQKPDSLIIIHLSAKNDIAVLSKTSISNN